MMRNAIVPYCFLLILVPFFSVVASLSAQTRDVSVNVSLDTNRIRPGEQVRLLMEVSAPVSAQITFPVIPDTLGSIEIVERFPTDTLRTNEPGWISYHRQFILTGFDPGLFALPPFTFYFEFPGSAVPDSTVTGALPLQVDSIAVHIDAEIQDIKPPMEVPLSLRELLPYIGAAVAALLIVFAGIYFWNKRRRGTPGAISSMPEKPAHEEALQALKSIQERKLWQQGLYKEYHSALSDIVRVYIERRFSVPAMEQTSDETIAQMNRGKLVRDDAEAKLRYILQLADMVKFAKTVPVGTENEQSMQFCVDFVLLTKPVTQEDFDEDHSGREVSA